MMAAFGRGMHRQWHERPWVLDDPYALPLIGPACPDVQAIFDRVLAPHLQQIVVGFVVARSRYAEDRLETGGFSQYVLLGAGLDSLAWRRPDLLRRVRILEVDHPNTQAWKRERAAAMGLPESDNHVFVPVDFETEELRDSLDRAGFDWSRPTLFSWLGVVIYLTRDAIATTLRILAAAGQGSGAVLTYRPPLEFLDDDSIDLYKAVAPVVAQLGEPFLDGLTPDDMAALVRDCGFTVDENVEPADLEARYFAGRKEGLRPYSLERILSASLP